MPPGVKTELTAELSEGGASLMSTDELVKQSFASRKAGREIGSLIDSGIIRPVLDRVFPFESTKEGLAYAEKGRTKGKVVVKVS